MCLSICSMCEGLVCRSSVETLLRRQHSPAALLRAAISVSRPASNVRPCDSTTPRSAVLSLQNISEQLSRLDVARREAIKPHTYGLFEPPGICGLGRLCLKHVWGSSPCNPCSDVPGGPQPAVVSEITLSRLTGRCRQPTLMTRLRLIRSRHL